MPHTVRELKNVLAFVPDDVEIVLTGCDCVNLWNGETEKVNGKLLLGVDLGIDPWEPHV